MSSAVESRVSTLESLVADIAYAQLRTERSIERLADEMREFKDEMREFKDEMQTFKSGVESFKDEMRGISKDLNRKWGELANRLGTVVEDIVAPNIPGVLSRYFDVEEPDLVMVRVKKKHPAGDGRNREFDVIAVTPDVLYVNETKGTIRQHYLDDFVANYREVVEYFPEYADRRVVPIMSSLYLPDHAIEFLTSHGVYAMMMSDDSMDIVNFERVSKR